MKSRRAPSRPRRTIRARAASGYQRARRSFTSFGARSRRVLRGSSNTPLGRPVSKLVAPTLAVGAELTLVTRPLSGGDSWIGRVNDTIARVGRGDTSNIMGISADGHNTLSILSLQIERNAPAAVVMAAESVILGAIGRFFGA